MYLLYSMQACMRLMYMCSTNMRMYIAHVYMLLVSLYIYERVCGERETSNTFSYFVTFTILSFCVSVIDE